MNGDHFNQLLHIVGPSISKLNTNFKDSTAPEARLGWSMCIQWYSLEITHKIHWGENTPIYASLRINIVSDYRKSPSGTSCLCKERHRERKKVCTCMYMRDWIPIPNKQLIPPTPNPQPFDCKAKACRYQLCTDCRQISSSFLFFFFVCFVVVVVCFTGFLLIFYSRISQTFKTFFSQITNTDLDTFDGHL